MRGNAVKGIALLADYESELRHPMFFRLLRRAGLTEADVLVGTTSEPRLVEQLQERGVRAVVTLGERALQRTIGEADIVRWRGRVVQHQLLPNIHVVPTFQPSQLMARRGGDDDDDIMRHPPRFHGVWIRDVHMAMYVAAHGFDRTAVNYLEDPMPQRFEEFADEYFAAFALDPYLALSWDIETFYKMSKAEDEYEEENANVNVGDILRISFSFREGYAVSVPWTPGYWPTIRRLLRTRGRMIVWNGQTFDVPVVQAVGFEVLGVIEDHMDAYHMHQSDLPKGLEWVSSEATDVLPWKHLAAARPAWYSCADADIAWRNAAYNEQVLRKQGQWELFQNHVVKLMPILARAGTHGNRIDVVKREEIRSKLMAMRDAMVAEIQTFVPRVLFPRTRYERLPETLAGLPDPDNGSMPAREPRAMLTATDRDGVQWDILFEADDVNTCSHCGNIATNKSEHLKGTAGPLNPKTGKPTRVKNPCKEAGAVIAPQVWYVPRFLRLEPFNPNSSDQLKAYMRHFNHPIGRDKRDSQKETADANHLKLLHKKVGAKFPLYGKSLVVHKVSKTIGTYTPEPDEHDLIHTQYVNSTATWRLGSRKVKNGTQMQNWGKRNEEVPTQNDEEKAAMKLAYEARKQIVPRVGHKLVQIDSSSVEAVLQGHYMNDPQYMELASKSIHAWLSCRALGLEFTPANVDLVKEKHAGLYAKMKVTNYLTNFGGGPRLMHDTYPEDFPTLRSAQETQDALYALLPSLRAYHHAVRVEAHNKTFLTTPWGYRHWYYDVFRRKPDGTLALSKDAKRAVAFKPQNSNAAFQRDNLLLFAASPVDGDPITDMRELEARWPELREAIAQDRTWAQFYPANVSVHDSLCIDCPEALVEKATKDMLTIFTRPIPQLRNLRVGAEVEVGDNWAERDEDNPNGMHRVAKVVVSGYTYADTEAGLPPGLAEAA